MVKVKICGITNLEDALFANDSGADALGFIFWRKSPRYISPKLAKSIVKNLGPFISKVGVFVDEEKDKVYRLASFIGLDTLQFHGKEKPIYCNFFMSRFRVIKTFFSYEDFLKNSKFYRVSAYLFDVSWEDKQRGKKTLDEIFLNRLANVKDRIIISGGLTVENVTHFIEKVKPYAVDVSSGVERLPGEKDRELVRAFIRKVKEHYFAKFVCNEGD
ncbi:MAG: phosphoribosylanthranilate isomerase [Candidatus Omnitrophica bacterium]|nr:phosphoribosylanthranilate isomerase [Candidatus Omnitrophota bacterium]MCM8827114.1 phosphoribosylanthranilate isomerase [Candidatus Omnitrophota bacterium]